jgi:quercetin dioxygenase-like cupin family protein
MIVATRPVFETVAIGVRLSVFHVNKFEGLVKHEHTYPHLTFCTSGSIVVRKESKEVVLTKDSKPAILIENEWHEIEALEDGTVFVNLFAENN